MQDDKPTWAAVQATERTYKGTPAAIHENGRIEDLAAITPKGLLQRHRSLLGNAQVVAVVTGPVKPLHGLKVLADKFDFPVGERIKLPGTKKLRTLSRPIRERMPSSGEQAHLLFTWSGGAVYGTPGFAPMLYADAMFGGYGMNRLFKVVREQHGLAYSVGSSYHRVRGTIVAQAAVAPARAEKAISLIRGEFTRLQDEFSDEEFAAVRESLIESRISAWDSQGARVTDAVFQIVIGIKQSLEAQLRDIRNVKPDQVRAVLRKMKPHSEFRLG
jgi:predicted Zn-dependent peptidase